MSKGSRDIELTETLIKKKDMDEPVPKGKIDAIWLKYPSHHSGPSSSQTTSRTRSAIGR